MTTRFQCLPDSRVGGGPEFVYTPPTLPTPEVPPVVDNGDQPPSLGRPIDDTDTYTGQVGSIFPGQPLELNYEPGMSPEGDYIHVLETGDVVTVKPQQNGSLPRGLSVDTNYYVEVLSETSIVLYSDHARTVAVEFPSSDPGCACVPVWYTWMDQWPPEQAFSLMQVPEALLGPSEYIPVAEVGVVTGFQSQIFLYAISGLGQGTTGSSLALAGVGFHSGCYQVLGYVEAMNIDAGDVLPDVRVILGSRVGCSATTVSPTTAAAGLRTGLTSAARANDVLVATATQISLRAIGRDVNDAAECGVGLGIEAAAFAGGEQFILGVLPGLEATGREWDALESASVHLGFDSDGGEFLPNQIQRFGFSLGLDAAASDGEAFVDVGAAVGLWLGADTSARDVDRWGTTEQWVGLEGLAREQDAAGETGFSQGFDWQTFDYVWGQLEIRTHFRADGIRATQAWVETLLWNTTILDETLGSGGMVQAYLGVGGDDPQPEPVAFCSPRATVVGVGMDATGFDTLVTRTAGAWESLEAIGHHRAETAVFGIRFGYLGTSFSSQDPASTTAVVSFRKLPFDSRMIAVRGTVVGFRSTGIAFSRSSLGIRTRFRATSTPSVEGYTVWDAWLLAS